VSCQTCGWEDYTLVCPSCALDQRPAVDVDYCAICAGVVGEEGTAHHPDGDVSKVEAWTCSDDCADAYELTR
jgi:hypothetical protein